MPSSRDPNDAPTSSEVAEAYWAAFDRLRAAMKRRLSDLQEDGVRGFFDVGIFHPFAPLSLRRSGKAQAGAQLRMTVFPVVDREAPLPFGWTRYELRDEKEIRVVARGDASQ